MKKVLLISIVIFLVLGGSVMAASPYPIYLPVAYKQSTPTSTPTPLPTATPQAAPKSPVLSSINNPDQDNLFTVTWSSVPNSSYVLQEATNPSFTTPKTVYHGFELSWTVPAPGKTPAMYYYRVLAGNGSGNSPWSNVQQVVIHPLFVGLHLRWDGNGYIRGYYNFDVGSHLSRDIDNLSSGYILRSSNHEWYKPNPMNWEDEYWNSYYSVTTGEFLSSSAPGNPDWKWGYEWILPYNIQFQNGQTVSIDGQAFIVSGPIAGYTAFGAPLKYWQLVNRDEFIFWDAGGDWKQVVLPGDIILRYDAGNSRLLIYDDIMRRDYYQGAPSGDTVHYIEQLTAANSFPAGSILSIPEATPTSVGLPGISENIQDSMPNHR